MKRTVLTLTISLFIITGCGKSPSQIENHAKDTFERLVQFSVAHKEKPPTLVFYGSSAESKCGKVTGSAYCPADDTIYFNETQVQKLYKIGPEAVDLVMAHEFAHAMQHKYGFHRKYTVLNELQADCLSGVYLNRESKNNPEKFKTAMLVAWNVGDFDWEEKDHHGFPNQRLQSFVIGTGASIKSEKEGVLTCLDLF